MKKLTYEVVKEYIENELGYILISTTYESARKKLIFKDNEGYLLTSSIDNLKHGYKPLRFHQNNLYTISNIKLWLEKNNKPFILLSSIYKKSDALLDWLCLNKNCGDKFKLSWECVFAGVGCGVCHGKQVGVSNCLAVKRPDLVEEWNNNRNIDITPFDVTSVSHKYVWWKCSICNNEWFASIHNRKQNGCPECNKSLGEKKIQECLCKNNLSFIPQKEFSNLLGVGNGLLSYDFFIPENNLLIEYQGEQHKRFKKGFHKSNKDFEIQVEHDRRKREYAKLNNYNLLEIWYYDFDNIEEILIENLKKVS